MINCFNTNPIFIIIFITKNFSTIVLQVGVLSGDPADWLTDLGYVHTTPYSLLLVFRDENGVSSHCFVFN